MKLVNIALIMALAAIASVNAGMGKPANDNATDTNGTAAEKTGMGGMGGMGESADVNATDGDESTSDRTNATAVETGEEEDKKAMGGMGGMGSGEEPEGFEDGSGSGSAADKIVDPNGSPGKQPKEKKGSKKGSKSPKSPKSPKTAKGDNSPKKKKGLLQAQDLTVGQSSFALAGCVALVAGVGFVAVRKYRQQSGYKIIASDDSKFANVCETTPLVEVATLV